MVDVFYDTEFCENGETIDLISIGMVDEFGNHLYAISKDFNEHHVKAHPWLREHVWPQLPRYADGMDEWLDLHHPAVHSREHIAELVSEYFLRERTLTPGGDITLWAWFGSYDHVALAQLYGPMVDLPPHIPMVTHELVQLWEDAGRPPRPPQPVNQHDALADAYWNRDLHAACRKAVTASADRHLQDLMRGIAAAPPGAEQRPRLDEFPF